MIGGKKTQKHVKPARCQCDPSCTRSPLPNRPFCAVHNKKCSRVAPLSGWEPVYDPDYFNRYEGLKGSHNCYAYGMDYIRTAKKKNCTKSSCQLSYPQPGRASGYPTWEKVKGKRCPDLMARVMGDVPGILPSTFTQKCPKGMRKIAPVTDPDEDYHFYRQDKNGYWSHKPGATSVTNKDSHGRPIYDPALAGRAAEDSHLDYDTFCGYWCVPAKIHRRLGRGGSRPTQRRRNRK